MNFSLIINEIPTFMHRNIYSATFFTCDRENVNILVFQFDKTLYLVRNRAILSEINLQNTVFKEIDLHSLPGSFELNDDILEKDTCLATEIEEPQQHFQMEKFVLNHDIQGKSTFVIIKLNEKLLAMELQESNEFKIVKQFEEVDEFVVLENPKYSYKPRVQILFRDGKMIETNFSRIEEIENENSVEEYDTFKYVLKSLEQKTRKLRVEYQQNLEETSRK